jgi:hypothetical protein
MIRTSLRLAGAMLAASLTVSSALAQAQPPGIQSTVIPQATATHLACAKDLVVRSGLSGTFVSIVPDMMNQVNNTVTRTRPELANDMRAVLIALQPEFFGYADEIVESAARVYTALIKEDECKEIVAFFNSKVGMKYVEVQPSIYANMTPAIENWQRNLSVRILDRVRAEMKKKGHEL